MEYRDYGIKTLNMVSSARIVEVIEVTGTLGKGTDDDPMGSAVQYWDLEGNLIATLWGRPRIHQPLEPAIKELEVKHGVI